jgi:hypothetical protein
MKLYMVETPEQLKELNQFCKSGATLAVATVWSVAQRQNGGCSPWDKKIMVSFQTDKSTRSATVVRISAADELREVAQLKYVPAIQWCRENLEPIIQR